MGNYNFGEKRAEWSAKQNKEIPVWEMPKFKTSRDKAVELIDSGLYGLAEADFWILMNETKSGKMAYSGLIISHNGCLKINDAMKDKFKPECVSEDKDGFANSLVMRYCCPEQGIYEFGEVSTANCKQAYPYAMAFKRLFDRVVLKLSKIAYAGIYSETEADEFKDRQEERETTPAKKTVKDNKIVCERCGSVIESYVTAKGKSISAEAHAAASKAKFNNHVYCLDCIDVLKAVQLAEAERHEAANE